MLIQFLPGLPSRSPVLPTARNLTDYLFQLSQRGLRAEWDEGQHPRVPAGTPAGGEFGPGGAPAGKAPGKFRQHAALMKAYGFKLVYQDKGPRPDLTSPGRVGVRSSTWHHPQYGDVHIDNVSHSFWHIGLSGGDILPKPRPVGPFNRNLQEALDDYKKGHAQQELPFSDRRVKPDEEFKQGVRPIEEKLRSIPVTDKEGLGGGGSEAYLITFSDGSKGVFKPWDGDMRRARANINTKFNVEREVGAWEVAKLVGMGDMVVPAVERTIDGKRGALLQFVAGDPAGERDREESFDGQKNLLRAAAFDFVIGNEDRHRFNWLVDGNKLHLIDHGLSFPDGSDYSDSNQDFIDEAKRRQEDGETEKAPRDMAATYVQNKQRILAALRGLKLPPTAVAGVEKRIGQLAKATQWGHLEDA